MVDFLLIAEQIFPPKILVGKRFADQHRGRRTVTDFVEGCSAVDEENSVRIWIQCFAVFRSRSPTTQIPKPFLCRRGFRVLTKYWLQWILR